MSFITQALGVNNGFQVQSAGGAGSAPAISQDQANEQAIYNQQGTLAQQLQAQANGQGPNLAQLQLQQATTNNNKQAAGQIGSVRGMNPAIAQRLIAQNAAAANQNAAGQSGILRAQQQLASEGAEANVYGQQAGEAATNLGTYVGANQAANQSNAQIAQNNANQNASAASGVISPLSSILYKGGEVKTPAHHLEELLIPTGKKVHPLHLSSGGELPHFGGGGMFSTSSNIPIFAPLQAGQGGSGGGMSPSQVNSMINQFKTDPNQAATGMTNVTGTATDSATAGGAGTVGGSAAGDAGYAGVDAGAAAASDAALDAGAAAASEGGANLLMVAAAHGAIVPKTVNAMVSPGERYVPPHLVEKVRSGKLKASQVAPKFPGKPKVQGDSEQNDTIATKLAPGGVVIKRSKADNDADAREFLQEIAKEKARSTGPSGYAKVLQKRRNAS